MNSLLKMRLMRNRILVIKNSYEYNKDVFLIFNNKIEWFFRFEMIDKIYDEKKILHWKMSRSNLIDIFILILLHSKQFHKIDWFKSSWNKRRKRELIAV